MKLEKITVRVGKTKKTKEYENVKPEVEISATLEEGDDLDTSTNQLTEKAMQSLTIVENRLLGKRVGVLKRKDGTEVMVEYKDNRASAKEILDLTDAARTNIERVGYGYRR